MKAKETLTGLIMGGCLTLLLLCAGIFSGDASPRAVESTSTPTVVPTQTVSEETSTTTVVTPTPFPEEAEPTDYLVRVGLKHGTTAQKSVTVQSDSGGTVGVVVNGAYTPAVGFSLLDTFSAKPDSGYYLQLTTGTTDFAQVQFALYEIRQLLENAGSSVVPYYLHDGAYWYVGACFYTKKPGVGVTDVDDKDQWTAVSTALAGSSYSVCAHTAGTNAIKACVNNVPVLVLTTSNNTAKIRVHPLKQDSSSLPPLLRLNSGSRYRGDFDLSRYNGSNLVVVNEVEVEPYLYGVVPAEMVAGSASQYETRKEGLKAQAVLARTKAYLSILGNSLNSYGFHLYCDTTSQMYSGYNVESQNTTKAVDATAGIVVTYNGKVISDLFYSANNGGYIETSNNVWSSVASYYVSKPDPWTEPDVSTPSFTGIQLSQQIVDYIDKDLGEVRYVNVISRSRSGRVIELLIEGSKNFEILKNYKVRNVWGLRSQLYNFDVDTILSIENQADGINKALSDRARTYLEGNTFTTSFLPDAYAVKAADGYLYERIRVYPNSKNQVFTLTVLGHGHGCGMSQDGAAAMSAAGKSYTEIIEFYFSGVKLTSFPKE